MEVNTRVAAVVVVTAGGATPASAAVVSLAGTVVDTTTGAVGGVHHAGRWVRRDDRRRLHVKVRAGRAATGNARLLAGATLTADVTAGLAPHRLRLAVDLAVVVPGSPGIARLCEAPQLQDRLALGGLGGGQVTR